MKNASPLRYPGGKWRISSFIERLIRLNNLEGCTYVEPYSGGASLALSLLFNGYVSKVYLNDLDPAIFAFWHSVLNRNDDFIRLLDSVIITPDEWVRQKEIYLAKSKSSTFELGFATFFLNRTNHSGILNGGMIGGRNQEGPWKLDARFNRKALRDQILRIGDFRSKIRLSCADALKLLERGNYGGKSLIYLDPPYFRAGQHLYLNSYNIEDHRAVSTYVRGLKTKWIVSYDDVPEIRSLYNGVKSRRLRLNHTARSWRLGKEVLFFSPNLRIPSRVNLVPGGKH